MWICCNAADGGVTDSESVVSVMGAFRHDPARLHLHPDQQALLGGGVLWWGDGACWENVVCRDRGGGRPFAGGWRDDGASWRSWLHWQVNVCVQVRTWIGFVF